MYKFNQNNFKEQSKKLTIMQAKAMPLVNRNKILPFP